MKNYEEIKYDKNFLHQVIIRIDFMKFMSNEDLFRDDIERVILRSFSKRGKDQIVRYGAIEVVVSNNNKPNTTNQFLEGIQKEFLSQDEKNKAIISNKFLVFEINKYTKFEDAMNSIKDIIETLFKHLELTAVRTGIRYINIFDSNIIRLQKKYFAKHVSELLATKSLPRLEPFTLIRTMNTSEYTFENKTLNFRYGMFNPDYPNELKNNSFALDFDCFTLEPFNLAEAVIRNIIEGHDAIQMLFEDSITDAMREVLINE